MTTTKPVDAFLGAAEGMASPHYLRLSLAAAMVLGAIPGRFYRDVQLRCINLLLTYPEGCRANCAYCGLARDRADGGENSFIRVDWPTLPTAEILERMTRYQREVGRVCLSMVTHRRAYPDTIAVIEAIKTAVAAPLSLLISPNLFNRGRLEEVRALGVDMVGIGLDAATKRVFERRRGRAVGGGLAWDQYWRIIHLAREVFGPGRVNCHIMMGIGENDRELVELFQRLKALEVNPYLFAFYPEAGSPMARRRRPSLVRFRRLQLAKYLLEEEGMGAGQVRFDAPGRIQGLDLPWGPVEQAIATGKPFLTDGCPDARGELVCTRPFGSYRPGESFRDFPFHPTEEDLGQVRRELRWKQTLRKVPNKAQNSPFLDPPQADERTGVPSTGSGNAPIQHQP